MGLTSSLLILWTFPRHEYQLMTLGSGVRVFACMSYLGNAMVMAAIMVSCSPTWPPSNHHGRTVMQVGQVGLQRAPNRHTSQM